MGLKIVANRMFETRSLTVDSHGITFVEPALFRSRKQFAFSQIDCILMSPAQVLSFQVGNEVFKIPTKPGNKKHQEVINALVYSVRSAAGGAS